MVRPSDACSPQDGVPGAFSRKCTVRVMTEERSALRYISFVRENNYFGGEFRFRRSLGRRVLSPSIALLALYEALANFLSANDLRLTVKLPTVAPGTPTLPP